MPTTIPDIEPIWEEKVASATKMHDESLCWAFAVNGDTRTAYFGIPAPLFFDELNAYNNAGVYRPYDKNYEAPIIFDDMMKPKKRKAKMPKKNALTTIKFKDMS